MKRNPGQAKSFVAEMHEQHQAGLLRFLVRRLCAAQDSADLAQEVYLRLLRVEGAELVRRPQAYIYAIASQVASQFRLRADGAPVTFDSEAVERCAAQSDDYSSDGELFDRLDAEQRVKRLLDSLPEVHRAVLVLRKREGLSPADIARELDLSPHTVKKYLHEALVRIRELKWED